MSSASHRSRLQLKLEAFEESLVLMKWTLKCFTRWFRSFDWSSQACILQHTGEEYRRLGSNPGCTQLLLRNAVSGRVRSSIGCQGSSRYKSSRGVACELFANLIVTW